MGNSRSVFSDEELDEYQELTYFTKKEVLHVYTRFEELDQGAAVKAGLHPSQLTMKKAKLLELPELKVNPFRDRILQIFSNDGSGDMTFEDFLSMMSVFSRNAPRSVKVEYAFKIYDFDGDDQLSRDDLINVVNKLTGGDTDPAQRLTEDEMDHLLTNVFAEADLDDDKKLSFTEFEHVMSKAPDFTTLFCIRL